MSLKRPGFGLPLEFQPSWTRPQPGKPNENVRFPHAISDFFATTGVALREQRMLDMISQITDKPRWWEKIRDEDIVAKWRVEACGTVEQQRYSAQHLDLKCFEYVSTTGADVANCVADTIFQCMDELRDKAVYFSEHGLIHVMDTDATIVKKDLDDDDPFWASLKSAAYVLEDVPDRLKDWHPGTDGLVLDLLHPSLFPLQYGKSRVLANGIVPLDTCSEYIGMGEPCPIPQVIQDNQPYHKDISWGNKSAPMKPWGSYQWLPSDISFYEGNARITS